MSLPLSLLCRAQSACVPLLLLRFLAATFPLLRFSPLLSPPSWRLVHLKQNRDQWRDPVLYNIPGFKAKRELTEPWALRLLVNFRMVPRGGGGRAAGGGGGLFVSIRPKELSSNRSLSLASTISCSSSVNDLYAWWPRSHIFGWQMHVVLSRPRPTISLPTVPLSRLLYFWKKLIQATTNKSQQPTKRIRPRHLKLVPVTFSSVVVELADCAIPESCA